MDWPVFARICGQSVHAPHSKQVKAARASDWPYIRLPETTRRRKLAPFVERCLVAFLAPLLMGPTPQRMGTKLCSVQYSTPANMGPNFVFHGRKTWPHDARGAALSEGGPVGGGYRAVAHVGMYGLTLAHRMSPLSLAHHRAAKSKTGQTKPKILFHKPPRNRGSSAMQTKGSAFAYLC